MPQLFRNVTAKRHCKRSCWRRVCEHQSVVRSASQRAWPVLLPILANLSPAMPPMARTGVAALGAAAWTRCRVTPTTKGDFCPTLPLAAAHSAQRLAERHAVRGLLLRGKVFANTTPAVKDIGAASICIQLEEQSGGRLVELLDGGYLVALRPEGRGTGFLPAVAGVPGRQGLDRAGRSRIGLAECLVMARPVRLSDDAEGHVTFLHDAALRGWLSDERIVDVVLLARVTDFFLGLNAGTWLRIRISDIASASARWLADASGLGDSGGVVLHAGYWRSVLCIIPVDCAATLMRPMRSRLKRASMQQSTSSARLKWIF
eukprot:s3334_g3.t1